MDRDLEGYDDIVRLRRGGANDVFLFTYADPTLKDAKGDGIGCVDATTARWIWRRAPIKGGRYTLIKAGQTTFVECSGYPEENHLAVRRVTDGSVMGHPWQMGRLRDFAISGTTVAVVSVKLVADGEVRRVQLYDEWGRVQRTLAFPRATHLIGLPRGFAVLSDQRTVIVTRSGRRVAVLG